MPALLVSDLQRTLAFWEALGFRCSGVHPSRAEATWAELERDDLRLQFHTEPPHGTPTSPICSGTFYVFPSDVDELASEWRERVSFAWEPEDMDYGLREFGLRDPDGYFFAFAQPV